jgi:membrane protein
MRFVERALQFPVMMKRALGRMLAHESLTLAQAAAYSAIVALFPALIVCAAVISLLPDANVFKIEAGSFFDEVLPASVFPLLTSYFVSSAGPDGQPHTARALIIAALVGLTGGSSTIATLMQGLHRAAGVPIGCWSFWQRRIRALLLVPLSLLPLAIASVLVVFGRMITDWIAEHLVDEVRPAFFDAAFMLRWIISLAGVVGLTALIYHVGVPQVERTTPRKSWHQTLPGAVLATVMWFASTLLFGWYVTRVANYSAVYGSLGAAIALLVWLYLVSLSVLCGAEFNEQYWR